jgi:hypothetical protein
MKRERQQQQQARQTHDGLTHDPPPERGFVVQRQHACRGFMVALPIIAATAANVTCNAAIGTLRSTRFHVAEGSTQIAAMQRVGPDC